MNHRKKISTTVYLKPEQDEALKSLSEATRIPVAEYIREGIDAVLHRYKDEILAPHPFLMEVK